VLGPTTTLKPLDKAEMAPLAGAKRKRREAESCEHIQLFSQWCSRLLSVQLQGNSYEVPYLHIRTIGLPTSQLKEIDHLEPEDSINILNHVQDLLAWD